MNVTIPAEMIISESESTRLPVVSGGWISRNDVEAFVRDLISLSELLRRTISGAKAASLDET